MFSVWMMVVTGCGGLDVRLSEAELQRRVDERFPVQASLEDVVAVKLDDVRVDLRPGIERVHLSVSVFGSVGVLPMIRLAEVEASSALAYRASSGEVVLIEPRLERLDILGVAVGDPGEVRRAVNLAFGLIGEIPVHQLEAGSPERDSLKAIAVRDGELILTL